MTQEYEKCPFIYIYGSAKEIQEAVQMLDSIFDLHTEVSNNGWLKDEGALRLQIQEAMERHPVKAKFAVDGNAVYPYSKILREYRRLQRSGSLAGMSDVFYRFLYPNFDLAHYNRQGFIDYYDGDFYRMKAAILDNAWVPAWYADLRRILDVIQERSA